MVTETPILDILNLWPSRKALADDARVPLIVVHRWHQRRSIPPGYDARLIDAAAARGIPLSALDLVNARALRDHTGHSGGAGQPVRVANG